MRKLFLIFICSQLLFPSPSSIAKPSDEAARAFDQSIVDERAAFENAMRNTQPGERTLENRRFDKQRIEEKIALDQSLEGLTLEEKQAAITAYQLKLHDEIVAHNQKLKQLPAEKVNLQTKRKEFDAQIAKKIKDFYSQ